MRYSYKLRAGRGVVLRKLILYMRRTGLDGWMVIVRKKPRGLMETVIVGQRSSVFRVFMVMLIGLDLGGLSTDSRRTFQKQNQ